MSVQKTNAGVTRKPKNNPEAIMAWLKENREFIISEINEFIDSCQKNKYTLRNNLIGAMGVYKSKFELYRDHEKAIKAAKQSIYYMSAQSHLSYGQKVA